MVMPLDITKVMRNIGMKKAMLISTTFLLLLEMSNWPKTVLVSSVSNIRTITMLLIIRARKCIF